MLKPAQQKPAQQRLAQQRTGMSKPWWMVILAVALLAGSVSGPVLAGDQAGPGQAGEQAGPGQALDRCDALLRDEPSETSSYECYLDVARRGNAYRQAAERLRAQISFRPEFVQGYYFLGKILRGIGDVESVTAFETSAALARAAGNHQGEIWSLMGQAYTLGTLGRRSEADPVLDKALEVAVREERPILVAQVETALGWQRFYQNRFTESSRFLLKAHDLLSPDGPPSILYNNLDGLAALAWATGRNREAMDRYREILERFGGRDAYRDATLRRNMALAAGKLHRAGLMSRASVHAIQAEALEDALETGNRVAEVGLRYMLAGSDPTEEGLRQIRLGLETARALGRVRDVCWGLSLLAERTLARNPAAPEEALAYADEAITLATRSGERLVLPNVLAARAQIMHRQGDSDRYAAEVVKTLDALDRIRNLQPDRDVRSRLFDRFGHLFDSLSSSLVRQWQQDGDRKLLELAFEVTEREHARTLLDTLDVADITRTLAAGHPAATARSELLQEISGIQARLLGNDVSAASREDLLELLVHKEREARELREEIARDAPGFATLRAPNYATIDEIQAKLTAHQALLMFRVASAGDDLTVPADGGSWLLCVTAGSVELFDLPGKGELERKVRMYLALLERGDRSGDAGAASLYQDLVAELVESLPAEVDQWIVIPDGILYHLPLETLAPAAGDAPIALRFALETIPSATAWLRFRNAACPSEQGSAALRVRNAARPSEQGSASSRVRNAARPTEQGSAALRVRNAARPTEQGSAALRVRNAAPVAERSPAGLRVRNTVPPVEQDSAELRVFAIADPRLLLTGAGEPSRGGTLFRQGLDLQPLPRSRDEVRSFRKALGGGTLLLGADASERAFKAQDLSRYRVLYLATHAVVDDTKPERSAIVLGRSDEAGSSAKDRPEDGMLQYREIVDLDLEGQVVLLSACRSGSGPVVGGEGVVGLANAFFLAGARTVVATLWPIQDRDAMWLMTRFGRYLGEGQSVIRSMAEAKKDAIDAGLPPAAWAGFVVLGDGQIAPMAGASQAWDWTPWVGGFLVLFVLLLLFCLRRQARWSSAATS